MTIILQAAGLFQNEGFDTVPNDLSEVVKCKTQRMKPTDVYECKWLKSKSETYKAFAMMTHRHYLSIYEEKNPLPPYPISDMVTVAGTPKAGVYAIPSCLSKRMHAK